MDLTPAAVEFRTGLFARLFRCATFRAIVLGPEGVSCQGPVGTAACDPLSYANLTSTEISTGVFWGAIVLADVSGRRLRAAGLTNRVVKRVAAALAARVTLHASPHRLTSLVAWAGSRAELVAGTRFISRWEHERWVATWADTAKWEREHRETIREGLPLLASVLRDTTDFWAHHDREITQANDAFVKAEVDRHAALFEDVNGRSLTAQQREIAVRNDTDVLVIAGAGTGKTQAIAGKVAYLVKSGLARPEEILIVAFNTKAAEELQDRAGRAGGAGIQAKTFHSLGNRILGTPVHPRRGEGRGRHGGAYTRTWSSRSAGTRATNRPWPSWCSSIASRWSQRVLRSTSRGMSRASRPPRCALTRAGTG